MKGFKHSCLRRLQDKVDGGNLCDRSVRQAMKETMLRAEDKVVK